MTTITPRTASTLFAAGLGILLAAAPAVAAAKKPDPCPRLQRVSRAKLERGLLACTAKGATDAAGRCSAKLWALYRTRLDRKGCLVPDANQTAQPARPVRTPVLAVIRADGFDAGDLAVADTEARYAELELRGVLQRLARLAASGVARTAPSQLQQLAADFAHAIARVDDAERTLADTESAIWDGFQTDPGLSWLIDEPLRVAAQQWQIEMRRLLGPDWRTEIVALRSQPACEGDMVGDRLIAAYGDGALTTGDDRSAEVAALGAIAAQLACLSARQTTLLDYALHAAYDRVEVRLRAAGLDRITGAFARLSAPVELLLLDAVKQAGDHALAWHWFADREDVLRDQVDRLGWATNDVVWLYDRIAARMIGFPPCDGADAGACVDVDALLASLADPRALGLGDCALSGMVAAGPRTAGSVSRYSCPSVDCGTGGSSSTPAKGGVSLGSPTSRLGGTAGKAPVVSGGGTLPWSHLTSGDLSMMQQLACGGVGGGGSGGSNGDGSGGSQGPAGSVDGFDGRNQCVQQALNAPRDPYQAFVRCAAAAAGRTPGAPGLSQDLRGIPTGPDCGQPGVADTGAPGSGGSNTTTPSTGSGSTTTQSGATTTTVAAAPTTTAPAGDGGSSTPKPCVPTGILDAIQKIGDCGLPVLSKLLTGESPTPSVAGAAGLVVSNEIELLKPENGQVIYDTAGAVMQHKVDLACAAGQLSDEECATLATMKPGEQADYLRRTGHLHDCADPDDCSDVCTSLADQAMQRMDDCQQQLAQALQPPKPGRLDPIIHPSPESDGGALPNDPLLSCLIASAPSDGGGIDLGCALVSCANGDANARAGSACCGAGASARIGVSAGLLLTEHTCAIVHCADGAAIADDLGACGCSSGIGAGAGGPAPAPSPAGPAPGPRTPGR